MSLCSPCLFYLKPCYSRLAFATCLAHRTGTITCVCSCGHHYPTQSNAALNAGRSNDEKQTSQKNSIPKKSTVPDLVERLDHSLLVGSVDRARSHTLAKLEHRLHNAELSRGGVETSHGHPVVDNHAGADNGATTVHTAGHKGHLQQRTQLVLVLDAGLGVHDAALVAEAHVAAGQDVVRNGLSEHLDAEHVGDDLFRLALEVWVHEGDVVVGADDVAEGGEALFDALDLDAVGDAVSQVLQLLVGRRGRDQQAFAVAGGQAADDAGAGDGGVADGDHILELGFEDAVEEWVLVG
jgi:hypothetical protein